MKNILIAAILLTLASCASPPPTDSSWGRWGEPNYVRNKYATVEVMPAPNTVPMVVGVGWSK